MKVKNIAHLLCSTLSVLLSIASLASAAPMPVRAAESNAAIRAIHLTIPNKAYVPIVTPALYKRQGDYTLEGDGIEGKTEDVQLSKRRMALPYRYIARRRLLSDTDDPETQKATNSDELSKRQFSGRRTPYHDMKRDLSSTTTLEGEAPGDDVSFSKRQFSGKRTPYHDMKRDLSSTTTLEGEAPDDGVSFSKRQFNGRRTSYRDMKRELTNTDAHWAQFKRNASPAVKAHLNV
jgi:hypothetical protein